MLKALGPRLQRLTMLAAVSSHFPLRGSHDSLFPAILTHCPLLARLAIDDLGAGNAAAVCVIDSCCWLGTHVSADQAQTCKVADECGCACVHAERSACAGRRSCLLGR